MSSDGYGSIQWQGKLSVASRIAWQLANGEIADGLHVCHRCDCPPCVNPAHLFLGTHTENMRDMWTKGRHPTPGKFIVKGERY